MHIQIRIATDDDADLLVRILRLAFSDVAKRFGLTPENCPTHPSYYTLEKIKNDFAQKMTYFIAEANGQTFGCVGLEKSGQDIFTLQRLAVLHDARRQGIGKALFDYASQIAANNGARAIHIAIIAQHADLQKWYESMGFHTVETKHFAHLPFDVTFMKHEI